MILGFSFLKKEGNGIISIHFQTRKLACAELLEKENVSQIPLHIYLYLLLSHLSFRNTRSPPQLNL